MCVLTFYLDYQNLNVLRANSHSREIHNRRLKLPVDEE